MPETLPRLQDAIQRPANESLRGNRWPDATPLARATGARFNHHYQR